MIKPGELPIKSDLQTINDLSTNDLSNQEASNKSEHIGNQIFFEAVLKELSTTTATTISNKTSTSKTPTPSPIPSPEELLQNNLYPTIPHELLSLSVEMKTPLNTEIKKTIDTKTELLSTAHLLAGKNYKQGTSSINYLNYSNNLNQNLNQNELFKKNEISNNVTENALTNVQELAINVNKKNAQKETTVTEPLSANFLSLSSDLKPTKNSLPLNSHFFHSESESESESKLNLNSKSHLSEQDGDCIALAMQISNNKDTISQTSFLQINERIPASNSKKENAIQAKGIEVVKHCFEKIRTSISNNINKSFVNPNDPPSNNFQNYFQNHSSLQPIDNQNKMFAQDLAPATSQSISENNASTIEFFSYPNAADLNKSFDAKIILYPPELGHIIAKLKINQNDAHLTITTANDSVRNIVEANLAELKESFKQSDVQLTNVQVVTGTINSDSQNSDQSSPQKNSQENLQKNFSSTENQLNGSLAPAAKQTVHRQKLSSLIDTYI